jgi:hypothetical protein
MNREIPELYEIAKQLCHDAGVSWFDPRTGKEYPPPKAKDDTIPPSGGATTA